MDGKFAHYGITGRGNAQWVGFHLNVKAANKFHSYFKKDYFQVIIYVIGSEILSGYEKPEGD